VKSAETLKVGENYQAIHRTTGDKDIHYSLLTGTITVARGSALCFIRLANLASNHIGTDNLSNEAWNVIRTLFKLIPSRDR
jgi:hypothetical protein